MSFMTNDKPSWLVQRNQLVKEKKKEFFIDTLLLKGKVKI